MATRFIPCPACARHVRDGDAACPFCGLAIAQASAAARPPMARMSRAALLAVSAASALAATDCSSTSSPGPTGSDAAALDSAISPTLDASEDDSSGMAQPLYGATAPLDAGEPDADAAADDSGFHVQPLYGAMMKP
jgi:hypothetical protein